MSKRMFPEETRGAYDLGSDLRKGLWPRQEEKNLQTMFLLLT